MPNVADISRHFRKRVNYSLFNSSCHKPPLYRSRRLRGGSRLWLWRGTRRPARPRRPSSPRRRTWRRCRIFSLPGAVGGVTAPREPMQPGASAPASLALIAETSEPRLVVPPPASPRPRKRRKALRLTPLFARVLRERRFSFLLNDGSLDIHDF